MKYQGAGIPEKILDCSVKALHEWNAGSATLDEIIDELRTDYPDAARSAADLLFSYFRHKESVDSILEGAASKGTIRLELKEIASCALSQALFQSAIAPESAVNVAVEKVKKEKDRHAAGFLNALLRESLRRTEGKMVPPSFPVRLQRRWTGTFGKEPAQEAVRACAENPKPVFRLRSGESLPGTTPLSLDFTGDFRFFECESMEEVLRSGAFREGRIYVQDPATALSVSLCGPVRGRVLDACAAPGGKTVMLADAAEPGTEITAADKSSSRLLLLRENLKRMKLREIRVRRADPLWENYNTAEQYDLVFLDAPCSNTGVVRRRPDALWRFSTRRLEGVRKLQRELLEKLSLQVLPGGILLYSTCSAEPEEGPVQAENFVKQHPCFVIESMRMLPPSLTHDGAFAARLRRKKG